MCFSLQRNFHSIHHLEKQWPKKKAGRDSVPAPVTEKAYSGGGGTQKKINRQSSSTFVANFLSYIAKKPTSSQPVSDPPKSISLASNETWKLPLQRSISSELAKGPKMLKFFDLSSHGQSPLNLSLVIHPVSLATRKSKCNKPWTHGRHLREALAASNGSTPKNASASNLKINYVIILGCPWKLVTS